MTADNRVCVFQIQRKILKVMELRFEGLLNFDIFDNKYFVVYRGENIVEVYTIESFINLRYRMRLPLYKDFENYHFKKVQSHNAYFRSLLRTYHENFMAFIMIDSQNTQRALLFMYCLGINQHNSFVFTANVSEIFGSDSIQNHVILTGDENGQSLAIMTSSDIHLYDVQYFNRLVLNKPMRQRLICTCKEIKNSFDNLHDIKDGKDLSMQIDNVTVEALSLFSDAQNDTIEYLNLVVRTINQGVAPSAKKDQDKRVVITYSNDSQETDQPYLLLHETYIEGQDLNYSTSCTYTDIQGQVKSCREGTIEETRDVPYYFPIEFVTATRRVLKSITFGSLFFMFDDNFKLIVNRLPIHSRNLDSVNGMALVPLFTGYQEVEFGCQITGFTQYFNITDIKVLYDQSPGTPGQKELYLFFYHCKINSHSNKKALRYALLTVFSVPDKPDEQGRYSTNKPFHVQQFKNYQELPHDIIDLQIVKNITKSKNKNLYAIFNIAMTLSIQGTYSNVFKLFNLELYSATSVFNLTHQIIANQLNLDTYKVTKMTKIPNSNLLVVVLEDYGAHIINVTRLYDYQEEPRQSEIILKDLNFMKSLDFLDQRVQEKGPLQVISPMFNSPNQLLFVTNYGIFTFDFPVDLQNIEQIKEIGYKNSFTPQMIRLLRTEFDNYLGEAQQNQYGSVFLAERNLGGDSYKVVLAAMSFYSAYNSRFFKILDITWNEKCYSLNYNSYFEFSPEDQIAVSFICNQYFYIYRVCMRPHLRIDMHKFASVGTNPVIGETNLGYNEFNLTIEASNDDVENYLSKESINVLVHYYERGRIYDQQIFLALLLIGTSLILFLLFYVDQTVCSVKKESMNALVEGETRKKKSTLPFNSALNMSTLISSNSVILNHQSSSSIFPSQYREVASPYFQEGVLMTESTLQPFEEQPIRLSRKPGRIRPGIQDESIYTDNTVSMDISRVVQ